MSWIEWWSGVFWRAEWVGVGNASRAGKRIGEEGSQKGFKPIIVNAVTFPIITRKICSKRKK